MAVAQMQNAQTTRVAIHARVKPGIVAMAHCATDALLESIRMRLVSRRASSALVKTAP